MKKVLQFLAMLLIVGTSTLYAQKGMPSKITADLESQINAMTSSTELVKVIIVMNDQYDATQNLRQTRNLDKAHKREYVVNELQRISSEGQRSLMNDLRLGERFNYVTDIKQFWIFNGVSCSMNKDMVYAIANRADVKVIIPDYEVRIPDGEDDENQIIEPGRGTNQWNVVMVNADDVWETGVTGDGVIVAVIDTGVNYSHDDIADNMWDGSNEGYPYHGWDFVNDDNNPMDDHSHGTHCAGTVSSYGTSGYQCGIAKDAKIMALKVLGSDGRGYTDWIINAMEFGVEHGAHVLSMSLGADGVGGESAYRIVMENLLESGVVASVAAGNTGDELYDYPVPYNVGAPGNCPSPWRHPDQTLVGGRSATVTVGATTSDDEYSYFSSIGPVTWTEGSYIGNYYDYPYVENDPVNIGLIKPDVAAPGSSIVSLYYGSNTGYSTKSGTSMATPCVAGVMALMLEANPMLTPVEIDSILEVTAVPLGGYTSKNNYFGAGRVDAQAAVEAAVSMLAPGEIVINSDTLDMGFRPNGAWMSPATLGLYNIGGTIEIQDIQISNPYFQMDLGEVTLPYSIGYHETLPVKMTTGNSSNNGTPIDAQITVYYGDGQQTQAMVTAIPYNPVVRDVWETAYQVNTFPFTDSLVPSSIPLYNNYNLPPDKIVDGGDAVYKLVFEEDTYLNASFTSGEDGKIALYTEDFMGIGGPDLNNNFTSILNLNNPNNRGTDDGQVNANRTGLIDELTVYDGSVTNDYVPLYGYYADAYLRMEMVYPASELSDMDGSDIQSMKFYASESNVGWGSASFMVFLTEVTGTTVNAFCGPTGTVVYEGALSIVDGEMNVTFTTPYHYSGGNLLVGLYSITTGSYVTSRWYGETVTGASLQGYSYNGVDAVNGTQRNFLPKTTFNYIIGAISNMTVPPGTYYLAASSTSDAWGVVINTDDVPCPKAASYPIPSDYSTYVLPTEVQLGWKLGRTATEYKLLLGSDYESMETVVDWTRDLTESYTVTGLANNTNYFWQVLERNDGCPAGVEGPIWGFTTELNGPENLYANDYQFYEGDSVQLVWTAIENPYILSYNIYQDNVLIGNTAENEYTVSGLTYNMDGYYFHVTAVYAGGESNNSNEVIVQFTGNGSVAGHVYEQDGTTPIPNANVTFRGYDEYGYLNTYSFTTNTNGYYSGTVRVGSYSGIASCQGYQNSFYGNSIVVVYNGTTSADFLMDEKYVPVCNVFAEYYPDANNSNGQNVRVHWNMDASGWLYYDNGINYQAIGAGSTQFYWGVKFDVGDYDGYSLTKVSLYDYANFEGEILIYQTEDTPSVSSGTVLAQQGITGNATSSFVEYTLNTPVSIDPSLPLWIVVHRLSGDNYVAADCEDQGDPNGRWVSLDGEVWNDLAYYDLYYTWMLRGYVDYDSRGEQVVMNQHSPVNDGPKGNRSFQYYRVYRTDYYNFGPFNDTNTVMVADQVTDTLFVDNTWSSVENGVYKYGVSRVYAGNRESAIDWGATASNAVRPTLPKRDPIYPLEDCSAGPAPFIVVPESTNMPILRGDGTDCLILQDGREFSHFTLGDPANVTSYAFTVSNFTQGACYMNGVYYYSNGSGDFGVFDPLKGLRQIASNGPFSIIEYNPADGKMYGIAMGGNSVIYEVNPQDGSYTVVGTMPTSYLLTFTITAEGRFIICDAGDECIKEYYPETGELVTLIAVDWNINYGQDMAMDFETNKVYWAAYNANNGTCPLYELDLVNNELVLKGYFVNQASGFANATIDSNPLQNPRESVITWSNALDKNMNLTDGDVNITVTLNSGDSPEGVTVHFTNLNATEQQLYPVADVTLDSTGFYSFDNFRRGDYRVTVSLDDYETITEEVSIWDVTALNYVLNEINYGLSNLYVSRTGWATWNDPKYGNAVPGIGSGDTFFVDFEDGALPADWTVIDADGDGYNWRINSELWDSSVSGYNGSTGFVVSQSYWNGVGVLYPDNYLVTNQLKLGGTLSFWACAQDASWAAEHFGIAVSINGNTNPTDFTMVQEWTMTAKGGDRAEGTRGDSRSQGTWYQYSVDLSAYAGQTGYIAFRHFNCYDMYVLDVDDISLDNGVASAKGDRHFNSYHVQLTDLEDNVLYQTTITDCYMQLPVEDLVDGQRYRLKVASDYSSGLGDWEVVDWNYQSCDNFEGVTDLNLEIGETANVLTWSYPTVETRSNGQMGEAFVCNWSGGNYPYGWYSFNPNDINEYQNSINSNIRIHGGDYCPLDGYVYGTNDNSSWFKIDPMTGEIVEEGYLGIIFYDCAWDYSSDVMYGVSDNILWIWDLEEQTYTQVASMNVYFESIACDIDGQLYGISVNSPAILYKIDKTNGELELVGSMGLNCNWYWQTCGFDHYTGKLYWSGQGFFAEVDIETGVATQLASTGTSNTGSFCVPFDGGDYVSPVTGVLGAMLYRDGELLGFTRETRFTDSIMPGNHEYEVRVVYDGKKRTPNFNAYYAMSCPTSIGGATYDVTVAAVPTVGGTVTGSGTYINGFPCTVTAVENDGFVFTNWTVNGQVVSSIPEYTFRVRENTTIEANFIGFVPHWTVVDNPDYEPTSLIGVVQYNGVEQGANYLEVAALCGTECRGKQLMTYYPEDDRFYVFMTIYGNDNDVITFSVYDHMESEETELYCLSRLNFLSNEIFGSTSDPYIIDFGVIHETPMQTGWNWYASMVEADGVKALEMLENSLGANGVMIKSQTDGFVMNYENYWVGNLTALSNDQMYMVKTDDQVNTVMAGYQTDVTTHSISVYPGWTWLGYPNGQAMDINDALANFTAKNGDLLKAKQSFASYIEGQGWIGSLMTLNPGAGLMYNSTRNVTVSLTYADQGNRQELMPNITAEQNHWVPNEFEYPENMSVMAVVELDGIEIAEGGYELAVFDGNKCVGSAQLVYVEPINRYVAFLTVSSEEGSALHFALYDSMTGMEGLAENDAVAFEPNAIIGSLDQPYVVNFKGMTDVSQDYLVLDIYPNPVDKGSQFRIGVSSDKTDVVTVEIVDALGAVVSSTQTSRKSALVTAPVSAGVYMVRVCVNGGETYCRKLIVK